MSWSYTVHQINRSFDQIARWYQDFLRRSEAAFRALHERLLVLEQQQQSSQGPSDEQVERVLRKILAERFSNTGNTHGDGSSSSQHVRSKMFFVKPPDESISIPRAPILNAEMLLVDPTAVPSKEYGQTFQMLEQGLSHYPQIDDAKPAIRDTTPGEEDASQHPDFPGVHGRPW